MRWLTLCVVATAWLTSLGTAHAGDLEDGQAYYLKACGRCHGPIVGDVVAGGRSRYLTYVMMPPYGPPLKDVFGRPAGADESFEYSAGFREATEGLVWTAETLDRFLLDSRAMIPGSTMFFKEPDAEKRRLVILYLEANS